MNFLQRSGDFSSPQPSKYTIQVALCFLLFALSLATRSPFVDRFYKYSFEPDSTPCIEHARSFYFFFEAPCAENAPHTLSSYPTYLDGDYIVSAIMATACTRLSKAGIITADLSSSDDSLMIYSMRWSSALMDAASMVFVFLILLLLTSSTFLSLSICLSYYLFNPQTLHVDLIRVDHYSLFAATALMWSSISLLLFPDKKRYFILSGLAMGLVSATKLNFLFYTPILGLVLLGLLYKKHLKLSGFILFAFSMVLSCAFMFQRWLMYPEKITGTVQDILKTGEDWFAFWGNGNHFYYNWNQFFDHGPSLAVAIFLLLFYGSLGYCLVLAIRRRNFLIGILCLTFVLQSIALIFSPKVGRYGMLMPVWVSAFAAMGIQALLARLKNAMAALITMILLVPVFIYSYQGYKADIGEIEKKAISIRQNRLDSREWIKTNVAEYSVIAVFQPHVSNPPIYDLPFVFTTQYLYYPFLSKDALCNFYPPSLEVLRQKINYIITSDKEIAYHFYTMRQDGCDTSLLRSWHLFYDSLAYSFPAKCFTSGYENYGVKNICAFHTNNNMIYHGISDIALSQTKVQGHPEFHWNYSHSIGSDAFRFQVQIAEDSTMKWLIYGSRDGYISKYRSQNSPQKIATTETSFTPGAIDRAFKEGVFDHAFDHMSNREMSTQLENFFADVLMNMSENDLTFGESLKGKMNGDAGEFGAIVKHIYAAKGDIMTFRTRDYLTATGLNIPPEKLNSSVVLYSEWKFIPPLTFKAGKRYYWRVRSKDSDAVLSRWSKVASFDY